MIWFPIAAAACLLCSWYDPKRDHTTKDGSTAWHVRKWLAFYPPLVVLYFMAIWPAGWEARVAIPAASWVVWRLSIGQTGADWASFWIRTPVLAFRWIWRRIRPAGRTDL